MSLPKEPRQKMINIMYLVLTAMLAINISVEILNAFKTINASLEKTNATVNASTEQIFQSLTDKLTESATAEKAAIWQPKAKYVIAESKKAFDFIEDLKKQLIKEAGGDPSDPTKKFKEDDQNMVTRVMVNESNGKKLFQTLQEFKNNILKDPVLKAEFEKSLPIDLERPKSKNSNKKLWEEDYFYMAPTVGALSILSKFQNDIKNAENKVVTYCHEQVGQVILRFDSFEAIVGQNSKYLMPGQEIEITAGLGAYSKAKLPTVTINGSNVGLNEKGQAVYKATAGGVGSHTVNVKVAFTDQDGKPQERTFPVEYVVGSANASIALDDMNVLYIGVPNKITIAASGGGDDRVKATISGGGGSLSKVGGGKYVANVTAQTNECTITVTVDGKVAGASTFRVRNIPEPVATVGRSKSGSNVGAAEFRSQGGVSAWIENFPMNLQYTVSSFTFSVDSDEGDPLNAPCVGNAFNAQAQQLIRQYVKKDKTVYIDNIKAKGPDGRTFSLGTIVYYIK